jgi:hypothetical protein
MLRFFGAKRNCKGTIRIKNLNNERIIFDYSCFILVNNFKNR